MQALLAFAPLLAFFVAYSLRGLYAATAVLIVAMLLLLAFDWLRSRRIPPMHALSTVLVLVFGGATLLLHNRLFIQWKPTERFLEPALEGRQVSSSQWRAVNAWSVLFYALLGGLNLAVAYGASERSWVYFKLFGLAILTFAFITWQVLWLHGRSAPAPAAAAPP
jgi:intracellular septation protein